MGLLDLFPFGVNDERRPSGGVLIGNAGRYCSNSDEEVRSCIGSQRGYTRDYITGIDGVDAMDAYNKAKASGMNENELRSFVQRIKL